MSPLRLQRAISALQLASAAGAFVFGSVCAAAAATRVWIDTDPSIGAPYREVDDAFALVLAFHSPEAEIVGISTTFGNAGVTRTTTVARDLVRRFGAEAGVRESNVHRGAAKPGNLETSTAATEALCRALQKGSLTYIALGPLTNLATLLRLHPELASRIERVIFIGGQTSPAALAFGRTGALHIHDANVFKAPEATRVVLRTNIPVELIGPEISGKLVLTRTDAGALAKGGSAAKFLQRKSAVWLWFWTRIVKHPGGPLFDSLGVISALRPGLVPKDVRYAMVNGSGELIVARQRFTHARRVTFATAVGERTHPFMLERLCREHF